MNLKTKELLEACNYPTDGTCDLSREEKLISLVADACLDIIMDSAKDPSHWDADLRMAHMRVYCAFSLETLKKG